MLAELAVRNLGVIADLSLVLEPRGMTALTGETGAGKTLVVEAISLLVGGRADGVLVRPGAEAAEIEGRFVRAGADGDEVETILSRVIPRAGRSRAYIDGRLASVAALADLGAELVDIHGQHAHQSLLHVSAQRASLDRYAEVDLGPLHSARQELDELTAELAALGGDERARAREIDLLTYQLDELTAAALDDPDEDAHLELEQRELADAAGHREAAVVAVGTLVEEGGTSDRAGEALDVLDGRTPFSALHERLSAALTEIEEVARELRITGERIEDDPERLHLVTERRQALRDLRRKYGEDLSEVIAYRDETARRLADLQAFDERAAALEARVAQATRRVREHEHAVAERRRAAAPDLAAAVQANLATLAMPAAVFDIDVRGDGAGDDVRFLVSTNPGVPPGPLAKVSSGGELARIMLALRMVLTEAPPTLVFDEVDAGIGGETAQSVARALGNLGEVHQVLVVTHLPQVAAYADSQAFVSKRADAHDTTAAVSVLDDDERVVELSRMLSGSPDSSTARRHAEELLAQAEAERQLGSADSAAS